ncbi:hypothetical protein GCM10010124_35340 [Pilimelia terevasa]|uniref:Uncharacterized protein n=1 Tax=Pilimelia terevasa TaxID=53372 RepID=A0A8J3BQ70_9ACTN|nr:hypothetical protein GCM10010124_35340 [Pilimelia terevasa]
MRIRLHGTPSETAATLTALAEVLDVHTVSCPYPDRTTFTCARVYIEATPLPTQEDR